MKKLSIIMMLVSLKISAQTKKSIVDYLPSVRITMVVDTVGEKIFTRSIEVNRMPINDNEFYVFFDEVFHNVHCGNAFDDLKYMTWIANKTKLCAENNNGSFIKPCRCMLESANSYIRNGYKGH